MEFCTESVGNMYFKHRSLRKYTRVARGQGGERRLKQIGEKAREKKRKVYVGLINLEKA